MNQVVVKLNDLSAKIYVDTNMTQPNVLIANPLDLALFKNTSDYKFEGNIKGGAGESAAICAWTGQRNVDGEVDVEGCWNIGEVTGVDGNGYNLVRRNSNIVPRNIVVSGRA